MKSISGEEQGGRRNGHMRSRVSLAGTVRRNFCCIGNFWTAPQIKNTPILRGVLQKVISLLLLMLLQLLAQFLLFSPSVVVSINMGVSSSSPFLRGENKRMIKPNTTTTIATLAVE